MRVDIRPQWGRLAGWYWSSLDGQNLIHRGMSIWEMLEHEYGALRGFNIDALSTDRTIWMHFPDEQTYTAFLLRWA